jgi:alkylation response protein AidB-like acyl-CoA dehydrogenase
MPIAISDDHRELAGVARSFLEGVDARAAARALLDAPEETLPPFWKELAGLGWLGLHLPEAHGGSGYGLPELAVVLDELGRVVAPGPFLPTVWASAVVAGAGDDGLAARLLPGLADGSVTAAVGVGGGLARAGDAVDGSLVVLGAGLASLLLLAVGGDLVVVEAGQDGVTVTPEASLDLTRRSARVTLAGTRPAATLRGAAPLATSVGRALAAAEAAGLASAATDMAAGYAKVRQQFGRVIGTFQGVKHNCAQMLVDAELGVAAAWDAARAHGLGRPFDLAAAVAADQAIGAAVGCAKRNIQVHGGIGFTWEHDAHLYLRRATTLRAFLGQPDELHEEVAALVGAGVARSFGVSLPPEAEAIRAEVRAFRAELDATPKEGRLAKLLDEGYVMPHWSKPWGRAAGAVEQLVIEEELRGVEKPQYGIGGWVIQTLTQHASPDQVQRWIRPSLEGTYYWCQLFSEPDAGSDAASIRTRGTRVDGGWLVTGQKIWTSGAQVANRGFATVRTNTEVGKHDGISMMVIDMKAKGVEVRPLREASGGALFAEVFFDEVFVPDDDVVGGVDGGWKVARSTLGNERVSIGSGAGAGTGGELLALLGRHPGDAGAAREVGALLSEAQAMRLLNLRSVERAIAGGEPGPEGNVTKLLSGEHAQRVADLSVRLLGADGALSEGDGAAAVASYIFTRALTIAGGTSEIVRNQIGERLLGLPRDPLAN